MKILILSLLLISCGTKKAETVKPTPPPSSPSAATLGYAISNLVIDIYNINLQGKSCGYHNLNVTCPNGGAVEIIGTTRCSVSGASRTTSQDLTYNMTNCSNIYSDSVLTLDGTLKSVGTATDISGVLISESLTQQATSEVLISMVSKKIPDYSKFCTFSIFVKQANASSLIKTTGTVCEKTF